MGEMKSAWQIAMEKADKLGKASPDELNSVKFVPEGNRLASHFLQDNSFDLVAEMNKHGNQDTLKYIKKGIEEILLRNITLPHNDEDQRRTNRSMEGLSIIKENKKGLEAIYKLISNLVTQYQSAMQQTYSDFKKKAEMTIQQAQRGGMRQQQRGQMPLDQQLQLQLQEEWRQIHGELDNQYDKALEEHRQKIRELN